MTERIIRIKKKTSANKSTVSVENIVDDLLKEIKSKVSKRSIKLDQFKNEYNRQFKISDFFRKFGMQGLLECVISV